MKTYTPSFILLTMALAVGLTATGCGRKTPKPEASAYRATLAGIRREREKVYADRAMTPEAKRERLDELQVMENKAVKKAMTDPKVKALQ